MSINVKQALVFVVQNESWVQKVILGGLFLFFPTFFYLFPGLRRMFFEQMNFSLMLLFLVLAGVVFLAVNGYFFKTIHNRIIHEKNALPSWNDFNNYTLIGLKSYIGGFIFSIPFLIFTALLMTIAPISLSKEIIPFVIIGIIAHFVYSAFYIMAALNFSRDFKIKSFLNIKKAFNAIKNDLPNYFMLVIYCILIGAANLLISALLVNAQIFALLLPFINFYACLVYTDLFAQFALGSKEFEQTDATCFS